MHGNDSLSQQAVTAVFVQSRAEQGEQMSRNRFERVDEVQPDAISLTLFDKDGSHMGIVHCPKTAAPDRLPADMTSQEGPALHALATAIQLANSKKIPIVVIDPDNLWNAEWGDLWRYEEEA